MSRLDDERARLKIEALVSCGGEAGGGLSDVPLHPADLGSHAFEEEMTLDLLENEERLIEEVGDALARIDRGAYGRCEACGAQIPRARLRALPYARHCVQCARQAEGHFGSDVAGAG
jgi:RNA polymerase-binding transcription factor DksA